MSATTKDLGPVTAYAYAVAGGYEGSEAEFTELVASLKDSQEMIADAFDDSKSYSIGEYVVYNGSFYKFTSNHSAGSWNSSHVEEVTVGEEVGELKTEINVLEPAATSSDVGKFLKAKTVSGGKVTEYEFGSGGGGGGGTDDYSDLTNKPQINGVTLLGNKSLADLGIAAAADIGNLESESGLSYYHNEQGMTELTVYGNSHAFNPIYLANRKNYMPDVAPSSSTDDGITVSWNGKFVEISGTASASSVFRPNPIWYDVGELPIGEYKIIAFLFGTYTAQDNPYIDIRGKTSSGSDAKIKTCYLNASKSTIEWTVTTSTAYKYITMQFNSTSGLDVTGTYHIWFGIFQSDVTITNTETTVNSDASAVIDIDSVNYPNGIDTVQHQSTVTYYPTVKGYVDNKETDLSAALVYLSPEMYGAAGDGTTDDTNAISACISAALSGNYAVRGFGDYLITSPIDINGDYVDAYFHKITYTGADYAIGYQGNRSTIKIHTLTSNGIGLYINATTGNTLYNDFELNSLTATKDGVKIYANYACYQNRLKFCRIAGGSSYTCILIEQAQNPITGYISEWNIIGGHLTNALWGIKGIMNDTMKFDVHTEGLGSSNSGGAFYATNGLIPSILYGRAGEVVRQNTFLKLEGDYAIQSPPCMFPFRLPLESIDISGLTVSLSSAQMLSDNTQIVTDIAVPYQLDSGVLMTKHLTFWANRFQFPPCDYRVLDVVDDIDMTDQYYNGIIPQRFIADDVQAEINLHPTYAANCLSTFTVEQTNGGELDIYDSTGNLIFDGSDYGNGVFKLTAYISDGYNALQFDMSNQAWFVETNNEYPSASGVSF